MLGVVQTDKQRLGQLSLESLRASRLVVDTGIHFYKYVIAAYTNCFIKYYLQCYPGTTIVSQVVKCKLHYNCHKLLAQIAH